MVICDSGSGATYAVTATAAKSSSASLVLDGPDDREPAGDAGRIGGRQHRHSDAEHERQADDRPRDPARHDRAGRRPARPSAPRPRARATMPSSAPARPRMPASTTTERQTWRRVIPAARRMPISRTRSMTFMVSVLTMPSAAMRTATSASASNRPKIRPSASLMAPWIRSRVTTSSGEFAGRRSRARRGPRPAHPGAKRTAKTSAPATPRRPVASFQPTSIASPVRPGIVRSTIPATREVEASAVGRRRRPGSTADREAESRGQRRRDDRRRRRRRARPAPSSGRRPRTAGGRRRPGRAPTTAAASVRTPASARSKVAIGLTRAIPATSAASRSVDALVGARSGGSR